MAKLSFTFETSTEEKTEMKAVLNFMLAINGIEEVKEPIVVDKTKAVVEVAKVTEEPKQDFSFTVSKPVETPKIEDQPQIEPSVPEVKEEPKEEPVTTSEEKTAEQIKEEKNAKRRERYAEAQKKKEEESKQVEESIQEETVHEVTREDDPTEHAHEVSKAVAEDNADENVSPEEQERLRKVKKQNIVRIEMAKKAEEGHREAIKKFLTANGIKGLTSMTEDQLDIVINYLTTI